MVAMMLMLLLLVAMPIAASAASRTISIEVVQVFSTNSGSSEETFTYRLKASKSNNPMPTGSTEEGYTFSITGNKSVDIVLGSINTEGMFTYTLYQVIERERLGFTYDKRVYHLEIHVDSSLNSYLIVKFDDGKKADAIEFINSYRGGGGPVTPPKPTDPPPTNPPPSPTPVVITEPPELPSPSPPDEKDIVDDPIPGDERELFESPEPDPEPEKEKPIIVVNIPKTGDDSDTQLLNILFALGGMMVIGAVAYLVIIRRRKVRKSE